MYKWYLLNLLLFIILIYSRIFVRVNNELWTDEIAQVTNLISLKHLIFEYLPNIPGGLPGHYLITLPLNKLFPWNKFVLGLPGLISQIIVFFFIPRIIKSLNLIRKSHLFLIVLITRIGFVFDPTLSIQAMEIRPYSLLPLLWVTTFLTVQSLTKFRQKNIKNYKYFMQLIKYFVILFIINIWHYYGFLMIISCFLFFTGIRKLFNNKPLLYRNALIIVATFISALPFWLYFSHGSSMFNFNTFEYFSSFIMQIYAINNGGVIGIPLQNIIYFILLILIILLITGGFINYLTKKTLFIEKSYFYCAVYIFLVLVVIPILLILALDLYNRYWFLYRQVSWVTLPFYIAIGVLIAGIKKSFLLSDFLQNKEAV